VVKWRHAGTHVVPQAGAAAAIVDVPAVATKPKASRARPKNLAPKRTKVKATMSHCAPPTPPTPPEATANVAQDVLDDGSTRYTLQLFFGFSLRVDIEVAHC
jgi:hypothetical protein